jgi:hypothetical protein
MVQLVVQMVVQSMVQWVEKREGRDADTRAMKVGVHGTTTYK